MQWSRRGSGIFRDIEIGGVGMRLRIAMGLRRVSIVGDSVREVMGMQVLRGGFEEWRFERQ